MVVWMDEGVAVTLEGVAATLEGVAATLEGVAATLGGVAVSEAILLPFTVSQAMLTCVVCLLSPVDGTAPAAVHSLTTSVCVTGSRVLSGHSRPVYVLSACVRLTDRRTSFRVHTYYRCRTPRLHLRAVWGCNTPSHVTHHCLRLEDGAVRHCAAGQVRHG